MGNLHIKFLERMGIDLSKAEMSPFLILPLLGGLVAMVVLFTYIKRPAPGLPFLNTGVLLGFGAALLITTRIPWIPPA